VFVDVNTLVYKKYVNGQRSTDNGQRPTVNGLLPPDVGEVHGEADNREEEVQVAAPGLPFGVLCNPSLKGVSSKNERKILQKFSLRHIITGHKS